MKILIIEDETEIAKQLSDHLKEAGFVTRIESDGEDGHFAGESPEYDLILLDLGLPSMDGFTILEKWRAEGIPTPVIILTARNSKMEVIRGLESGADDYIPKPFDLEEVLARINSTLRRSHGRNKSTYKYKNISLDTKNQRVTMSGKFLKLTRTEYLMIKYLFLNQGRPISVNELVDHTYEDFDKDSGIVARHIANIRKKIGNDIILTEANRGYFIPLETENEKKS